MARGWCQKHYGRWKATGDPTKLLKKGPKPSRAATCAIPGCDSTHGIRRNWCAMHYNNWRKYGDPLGGHPPPSLPGETWRAIPGYEGIYDVSDLGRVRSLPRKGVPVGCILTQFNLPNPPGYFFVHLTVRGKTRSRTVHQLVAAAFIGPRPAGHDTRHLDGNPLRNVPGNLAYGTRSENMQDMLRHGTNKLAARTHCDEGHKFTPENTYIRSDGGRHGRRCRICDRAKGIEKNRRQRARKRAASPPRERVKAAEIPPEELRKRRAEYQRRYRERKRAQVA